MPLAVCQADLPKVFHTNALGDFFQLRIRQAWQDLLIRKGIPYFPLEVVDRVLCCRSINHAAAHLP
jgi:hypothetical protein